jgi:hypothetical protein
MWKDAQYDVIKILAVNNGVGSFLLGSRGQLRPVEFNPPICEQSILIVRIATPDRNYSFVI